MCVGWWHIFRHWIYCNTWIWCWLPLIGNLFRVDRPSTKRLQSSWHANYDWKANVIWKDNILGHIPLHLVTHQNNILCSNVHVYLSRKYLSEISIFSKNERELLFIFFGRKGILWTPLCHFFIKQIKFSRKCVETKGFLGHEDKFCYRAVYKQDEFIEKVRVNI